MCSNITLDTQGLLSINHKLNLKILLVVEMFESNNFIPQHFYINSIFYSWLTLVFMSCDVSPRLNVIMKNHIVTTINYYGKHQNC